ncbi:hypothetical protein [Glycomyces paridis]|uniref:Uncharacterized protein n=1 Tax=Glycomyces paridis TaxID=2126555 RepID=A0A4S8P8X0_9ACTN|nr:hypothetical protein [Glycomyces paridis]THV24289.1 hypothetical protein E9998_21945 [Glycomyces paridis]
MEVDGVEYFPVTGEAEALALVHAKSDTYVDSRRLAEYAVSLGVAPPRYTPLGVLPLIVTVWFPGATEGLLVWDLHEMEEGDPDEGRP